MNRVILAGRLVRDPDVRYSPDGAVSYARYSLAVDRKVKKDQGQQADFFSCVVFGKGAEFAEKYLKQGTKIMIQGRLQSSTREHQGVKLYETSVIIDEQEFAESKKTQETRQAEQPEGMPDFVMPSEDEGLPFQ